MCVINYLASKTPGLRMTCSQGVDSNGIKWSGEVAQGGFSVRDVLGLVQQPLPDGHGSESRFVESTRAESTVAVRKGSSR
jgi:hypothetical protein